MSEVKTRRSKQRDTIYDILANDHTHPSAEDIFAKAREVIPDISLGTVYRNLNFLADNDMIRRLHVGDSIVHYDGNMTPHYHMICEECGKIVDITVDKETMLSLADHVEEETGAQLRSIKILFHGICKDCAKRN